MRPIVNDVTHCVCPCVGQTDVLHQERLNRLGCCLGLIHVGQRNHVIDGGQERTNCCHKWVMHLLPNYFGHLLLLLLLRLHYYYYYFRHASFPAICCNGTENQDHDNHIQVFKVIWQKAVSLIVLSTITGECISTSQVLCRHIRSAQVRYSGSACPHKSKVPLPVGDLDLLSNTQFFGPTLVSTQTAHSWPNTNMDTQTDTQTILGRIYAPCAGDAA